MTDRTSDLSALEAADGVCQVLPLLSGDVGVRGRILVAGEAEDHVPETAETPEQVEHEGPVVVVLQHQTGKCAGHHCTDLVTCAQQLHFT